MAVSVVVVSYNTCAHLRRCLASLQGEASEVIVVDNASQDGSADMVQDEFPWAKLVRLTRNVGFGAANNYGLDLASEPLVLFLNSDCIANKGAIHLLAAAFDDHGVVAAGGRLLDDQGNLQNSCCSKLTLWRVFCEQLWLEKLFKGSRLFDTYWLSMKLAPLGPGPHEVEQVMGACLMIRTIERFDEAFFLYCEDTELCHRLRRHGKILYVDATFTHALGASTENRRGWAIAMYNLGKEKYFRIHSAIWKSWLCFLLNRLGGFLRLIAALFKRDFAKVRMFDEVVFGPIGGPALPPDAQVRP
ncbi:MAG: glycosyltransferase family 2 protein [Chthonomonas sp.]|nr:glycosyltransferase family 2 protein [Chthonomonas sp.]